MHKNFWLSRDAGCLADENIGYENCARIEPKRSHQWFVDGDGSGMFNNNKKLALEGVNGRPVSGFPHLNGVPWDPSSGFQSVTGQFADCLYGSEDERTANLIDRNNPSAGSENMNIVRKHFQNQYENDSSMSLSMSHTFEDPTSCLNFGGIRKVKVNQVRDLDKGVPVSVGHSYTGTSNSVISLNASYGKGDESINSLNPSFNDASESMMMLGTTFSKTDESLASLCSTFSKGDGSFMLMGHNYGKGEDGMLSMGQSFHKLDGNFISIGQTYGKEDSNFALVGSSYNKGQENFMSICSSYEKRNGDHIMSLNSTSNDSCPSYSKEDSSSLPAGLRYNKGESCTISFGTLHDKSEANMSGGIISNYDLFLAGQGSDTSGEANANIIPKENCQFNATPKNKEPKATKKVSPSPNTFPSNVKSLLSTGIFDGVPVKYVSWSREKNLEGVIKGTGYLCSCDDCGNSKALNAYEFERHAGAKTKHPNNHIYFENGKTIYVVVQELKTTPQEMLFDVIQTVTGSPINQKNFRVWKASFQAATRELQRIYGKDGIVMES